MPENNKSKILLVEDNLINQEVALSMLLSRGYDVTIVNNGAEAIAKLETRTYDIILMDVEMPVMNGYEATSRIREMEEKTKTHIHIIGLTANTMIGDREKCLAVGMDDYISKPVHLKELMNGIEKISGRKESIIPIKLQAASEKLPVELNCLIDKLGGNNKQVLRCLEIFKTDTPKLLEAIETSLKNKDRQGLKNLFHSLRGMLLTMEMHRAASTVAAMDAFVREENFENSHNLFSALTSEIEFAVSYIERSMQADAW